MDLLLRYKWEILIACEIIAWLTTFYMFYARYWLHSKIQFLIFGSISIVLGYFPHIGLGIMNFIQTKKLDFFTLFILLLFLFAFTLGKKYVVRLDLSIKKWALKKQNKPTI